MVKHASWQLDMVPDPIPYTSAGSLTLPINKVSQKNKRVHNKSIVSWNSKIKVAS